MGKYNKLLVEFMVKKNRIIKRLTGLLITTKSDMDELRAWPEDTCKYILSNLGDRGRQCCPWCFMNSCASCSYGKRNGQCSDWTSRYRKLWDRNRARTEREQFPGVKELVSDTKKKFDRLRRGA